MKNEVVLTGEKLRELQLTELEMVVTRNQNDLRRQTN